MIWLTLGATGIIFDNTRYKDALKHDFGGGIPDFANRNIDTQYWVWWPREAASKGRSKGLDYNLVGKTGWDAAFNLTASYRRDSDVTRIWGTTQNIVNEVRWDSKAARFQSFQEHIADLMAQKRSRRHTGLTTFIS